MHFNHIVTAATASKNYIDIDGDAQLAGRHQGGG